MIFKSNNYSVLYNSICTFDRSLLGKPKMAQLTKLLFPLLAICLATSTIWGQHRDDHAHQHNVTHNLDIYDINFKKEMGYIGTGIALNLIGAITISKAEKASLLDIENLDVNDLWRIDRGATRNFSSTAESISDVILISGATLPFLTFFTHNCRKEASTIGILALETILINAGVTNITKGFSKRYRPFNYNPNVPDEMKLGNTSRLSFFSGHASATASFSFMAAKVFTDLHPDQKNKGLIWATAATFPAVVSILRYEAGKHFPTDLITGYAIGATIGYLIPQLHISNKLDLTMNGTGGVSLIIHL